LTEFFVQLTEEEAAHTATRSRTHARTHTHSLCFFSHVHSTEITLTANFLIQGWTVYQYHKTITSNKMLS